MSEKTEIELKIINEASRLLARELKGDIKDITFLDNLFFDISDKVGHVKRIESSTYNHRRPSTTFIEYLFHRIKKGELKI